MATITGTTVEVKIGEYTYRAELDGNKVELYRDGVHAGSATWSGQRIDGFPAALSEDARDALSTAIGHQLGKAWRARPEHGGGDDRTNALGPRGPATGTLTPDAANRGQMGNEAKKPSRQGEKEVGTGGPGHDPNTGEVGGQAIHPHRRAVGDGFTPPPERKRG